MNKKIVATLCVLAVTIGFGLSNIGVIRAEESGPGTSSDPVVTKGYVDRELAKFKGQEEMIEVLSKELNALKKEVSSLEAGEGGTGGHIYEVVDITEGEALIGKQGTEIILRAGQGVAITSYLGGLQDATGGVDIQKGFVPANHLLIIPRDDGRGVLATTDATFMVRGEYSIQ